MENLKVKVSAGTVRITIPAHVAADINQLHKSFDSLAERLGCKPCFSGSDCFFQLERDYRIDEKFNLQPIALNLDSHAKTHSITQAKTVEVIMPAKAMNNLNIIKKSIKDIAKRMGHEACATGCNTFFREFRQELVIVDQVGEIQQQFG